MHAMADKNLIANSGFKRSIKPAQPHDCRTNIRAGEASQSADSIPGKLRKGTPTLVDIKLIERP